jgi:hypothetical protein
MRMMMKLMIDTRQGNEAFQSGKAQQVLQTLLEKLHPEAAYFGLEDGSRCGFVFFDMTDQATMPTIGEPLFMELGASITLTPVMNGEDLMKGLQSI